ncbi:MAG: response regulator [Polyangiales bacterium]
MSAILIVDDSLTVRMDLSEALEAAGFRAVPCRTITEARAALRTQQIALAILDVRLPDGDGIDLLAQVRGDPTLSTLPVLMLSSEAEIKDRIRFLRNGANDYVGKPYDTAQVIARIRQLIGGPQVRDLVLVVDNDAVYRAELGDALVAAGFAVATAPTGAAGLQLASSARPTAIAIAGAMTDIDGASVIRRLRLDAALRTTPCLLLAANAARDAEVLAFEAGADSYVAKGDVAIVVARMKALLRSASPVTVDGGSLLAPKRILCVDDDPDFLDIVGDRLRKRGYDVVRASSGEEALQLLDVQCVDCILLDRSMAGIGGIETCRRLKARPAIRETPLIILTSTDAREAVLEGLAAGAEDFVSKGAGFDVLCARVAAQIRRKQVEDEQRRVRGTLLRCEIAVADAETARARSEARAIHCEELEQTNRELAAKNQELEAFGYALGHDLRSPLRTVNAFTHALIDDLGVQLDLRSIGNLRRVLAATSRMGELVDALVELSHAGREPVGRHLVDLSSLATAALDDLARRHPERSVTTVVEPNLVVEADGRLLRIALDRLLSNAWKFTADRNTTRIELGVDRARGEAVYFVRDNGASFDPSHAGAALCGTSVGLATVRRIVERHGGRIWAERAPTEGRQVLFTLPPPLT